MGNIRKGSVVVFNATTVFSQDPKFLPVMVQREYFECT